MPVHKQPPGAEALLLKSASKQIVLRTKEQLQKETFQRRPGDDVTAWVHGVLANTGVTKPHVHPGVCSNLSPYLTTG